LAAIVALSLSKVNNDFFIEVAKIELSPVWDISFTTAGM